MLNLTSLLSILEKLPFSIRNIISDPLILADEDLMYSYKEDLWIYLFCKANGEYLDQIKSDPFIKERVKKVLKELSFLDEKIHLYFGYHVEELFPIKNLE